MKILGVLPWMVSYLFKDYLSKKTSLTLNMLEVQFGLVFRKSYFVISIQRY